MFDPKRQQSKTDSQSNQDSQQSDNKSTNRNTIGKIAVPDIFNQAAKKPALASNEKPANKPIKMI